MSLEQKDWYVFQIRQSQPLPRIVIDSEYSTNFGDTDNLPPATEQSTEEPNQEEDPLLEEDDDDNDDDDNDDEQG